MKILYSFNKKGFEANYWSLEISNSSTAECQFIPFNHDPYLDSKLYTRAQLLDNIYYHKHPGLTRMYSDLLNRIHEIRADVLLVDNAPPYHPEFLRKLDIYKVLRTSDGPITSYDRDFAYLHAYDHVLYHSPAYSKDINMKDKLLYCGAKLADFWPLASFDTLCDPSKTELNILSSKRDIDVVFIGALHLNKMPILSKISKSLGSKLFFRGLSNLKKNLYFNFKYCFPGWVKQLPFEDYVPTYQRSKIGINIHNRGDYTVGSYRLFDLPANGVMQISDGGKYLNNFFSVGEEIESYRDVNDLLEKILFYLSNDKERERIALNGFRRVRKDYRITKVLHQAYKLIKIGMAQSA